MTDLNFKTKDYKYLLSIYHYFQTKSQPVIKTLGLHYNYPFKMFSLHIIKGNKYKKMPNSFRK